MKIVQGQVEGGIEVGNHFDKYGSKNPIAKYLMQGFTDALDALVKKTNQNTIHEIGCGEGHWTLRWLAQGKSVRGCDFSKIAINLANQNAREANVPLTNGDVQPVFSQKSIYDLSASDSAPLVVCCEVLEHLEYPEEALQKLTEIAGPWLILSVPTEPIWRILNMARGKYLGALGNTPGHIQHWSATAFIDLVEKYADVIEVKTPLPWTMVLCKVRQKP
jgi:SAM-dependent methyltransferase